MVTQIKIARNAALMEGVSLGSLAEMANDEKALAKAGKGLVQSAIAARSDSFGILAVTAAVGAFLLAKYGHTETINNLFTGLLNRADTRVDANALRTGFLPALTEKYGQGGIEVTDSDGNRILDAKGNPQWSTRPTLIFQFITDPGEGKPHIVLNKVARDGNAEMTDKEKAKALLIRAGRDAIIEAGIENLSKVEWMTVHKVLAPSKDYDADAFRKDAARLLTKAAENAGDDPDYFTMHNLREMGRVLGLGRGTINGILNRLPNATTRVIEHKAEESESVLIKTVKPEGKTDEPAEGAESPVAESDNNPAAVAA